MFPSQVTARRQVINTYIIIVLLLNRHKYLYIGNGWQLWIMWTQAADVFVVSRTGSNMGSLLKLNDSIALLQQKKQRSHVPQDPTLSMQVVMYKFEIVLVGWNISLPNILTVSWTDVLDFLLLSYIMKLKLSFSAWIDLHAVNWTLALP